MDRKFKNMQNKKIKGEFKTIYYQNRLFIKDI